MISMAIVGDWGKEREPPVSMCLHPFKMKVWDATVMGCATIQPLGVTTALLSWLGDVSALKAQTKVCCKLGPGLIL